MHKHCASQKHSLDLCPCKHKELHTHGHIADTKTFLYYNYYSPKKGTHGESNETGQPNRKSRELNQKGIREIQKSRYNKRSCLSRLRHYQACIKIEAHQRGKEFTTPTVAEERTRGDSKTQDPAPGMETETILHCVTTMLARVHSRQLSTQVPGRRQKMWYPEKGHNRLSILFYLLHIAFQPLVIPQGCGVQELQNLEVLLAHSTTKADKEEINAFIPYSLRAVSADKLY